MPDFPWDLDALPYVTLDKHDTLPTFAGVYFVHTPPVMLYIGATRNLHTRLKHHNRLPQFFACPSPVFIAWMPLPGKPVSLLQRYECEAVAFYHPQLNGKDFYQRKRGYSTREDAQARDHETQAIPQEDIIQAATRTYTVAVFCHPRSPGKKPAWIAYIRDYSPNWEGCCIHLINAEKSEDAKWAAIAACKQHRALGA